jgi:organic hydroperoxide reductase OsmC/OhrA
MKPYPHLYSVTAEGSALGAVSVVSAGLPTMATAPPPEFDGPGGVWSPETLLVAAIADCFILTFRGVARAGRFEWVSLDARVDGTLERVSGVAQFVRLSPEPR